MFTLPARSEGARYSVFVVDIDYLGYAGLLPVAEIKSTKD